MKNGDRWLLPDGVEEILPPRARQLEILRRDILDLYAAWGYDLVITPLIEFLDSLLIVPSSKLQLRTFKIVDQITGRSMGVRADLTAQAARIDAHVLNREGPTRLCYADSVLHTKPSSLLGSRSPIRIGAELYGHAGNASDIEVMSLMLETLAKAGLDSTQLALGHVQVYRPLVDMAGLDQTLERRLFKALQRKAHGDIEAVLAEGQVEPGLASLIATLPTLYGDRKVLEKASQALAAAPPATLAALDELQALADAISRRYPEQSLYFDLAELRGYEYHTGVVFACYVDGYGEAISKGGRYDHIGEVFGRARAATGFDLDLKTLLSLSTRDFGKLTRVFAPDLDDAALRTEITRMRNEGTAVVMALEGQQQDAKAMDCTHQLVMTAGKWICEPV